MENHSCWKLRERISVSFSTPIDSRTQESYLILHQKTRALHFHSRITGFKRGTWAQGLGAEPGVIYEAECGWNLADLGEAESQLNESLSQNLSQQMKEVTLGPQPGEAEMLGVTEKSHQEINLLSHLKPGRYFRQDLQTWLCGDLQG